MEKDFSALQQPFEVAGCAAPTEELDPDGRIDDDQERVAARRRRGASAVGIVPPSAASRLRAFCSISARSPNSMTAVFPFTPVAFCAASMRSGSRSNVVLMHMDVHHMYASVNPNDARVDGGSARLEKTHG